MKKSAVLFAPFLLFLLFLLFQSCGTDYHEDAASSKTHYGAVKTKPAEPAAEIKNTVQIDQRDGLAAFFIRCESDLEKAGAVVEKKEIINSLSHLRFMDTGGDKYYLLERENISEMIDAVTQKIYSDYILVSQNGTVIYTKTNNSIFSKNIKSQPDAFISCYAKSAFISDVSKPAAYSGENVILFSKKISGGTLILQLDISRLGKVIGERQFIIGAADGLYRIAKESAKMDGSFEFFDMINKDALSAEKSTMLIPDKNISGRLFTKGGISWIVLKNEKALN